MYFVDTIASGIRALPPVPLTPNINKLQGFHYPRVELQVDNFFLIDAKCLGRTCDAIDSYNEGSVAKECPCFSAISRLSAVIGCFDLQVINPGSNSVLFEVRHFTSRRFTSMFLSSAVPVGMTASTLMLQERTFFRNLRRNIMRMVQRINSHNAFSISGWARRGFIRDIASTQSPSTGTAAPNAAGVSGSGGSHVAAANLVHHAISILPNADEAGALPNLDDLLISFDELVGGGGVDGGVVG